MKSTEYFYQMEKNYLQVDETIHQFEQNLNELKQLIPNIQTLSNYYLSPERQEHLKMEKEGKFKDSTTAVLGEDYAYNTLSDVRTIALEMLEVATELLKSY